MCSYHSLIYSALNTGGKLSPITSPQLFRCLDGIDGRVLILPLVSPLHRQDNEFQQKTTASDFAGADSQLFHIPLHTTPVCAKDLPDASKQNQISLRKQRSNSQTVHSPSSGYALRSHENHTICDKGQPWRRPTPTENMFDFLPRIWRQLI